MKENLCFSWKSPMNEFNGFKIKLSEHENNYVAQILEVQSVVASADTLEGAISKLKKTW